MNRSGDRLDSVEDFGWQVKLPNYCLKMSD